MDYFVTVTPTVYSTLSSSDVAAMNAFVSFYAIFFMVYFCVILIVFIISCVAFWKIFEKAGIPGWAGIIPYYSTYKMIEAAGKPGWWLVLYFVPILNLIVALAVAMELGKAFGKDQAFSIILLWLIPIVGYLILAFDSSQYTKPIPSENLF